MADLSNKLKQSLKDQSINLKFIELLNSNRQVQSIKDRQILPSIPLSSFNQPNGVITGLPSIYKQRNAGKLRSMSEAKLRNVGSLGEGIPEGKGAIDGGGIVGNKIVKQESLSILQTAKNISNHGFARLRKKSVSSAKKSVLSRSEKQQILAKKLWDKPEAYQRQRMSSNPNIQTLQIISKHPSQKVIIQVQVTPQKLKLDLPASTKQTSQTKIMSNKTIHQIGNQAMENLMFNLKFGKIQQNISYKSFMKKQVEPTPQEIVKKLQQWISKYKIKNGLIYTKNLHKIFSRRQIPNNMILAEFTNYNQLKKQLINIMPGLKFYQNQQKGRNFAAVKIQSLFHMIFEKNYAKKLKSLMSKVKIIQTKWRSALAIKRLRQKMMASINMKIQKSKMLTNNLLKNWQLIKTSPRVQVHICSIALQQFKRLSIADLQQRQVTQLTRIFKSAQTDCTIIYVTPYNLSGQILRYYERVFSFGNMGQSFRNRLYFISVQKIIEKISLHMTTVSALLYSSQSLKRIRQIIKDKQQPIMNLACAYIVPSYPSNQYINLSAQLDIPIFSSSQPLHKLYSTKSGAHQILKQLTQNLGDKCPFSLPKTIHSIYSQKQLINTLSVLVYKNKQIKKWLLKIDDEINSRGIAIFNVDSLVFLKQLRKQDRNGLQQQSMIQQIPQNQMIKLIADELKLKLKVRLKILHKNVYNDYDSYISHFLTRGGVLQACIEQEQLGSVNNDQNSKKHISNRAKEHSIAFKISPNGQFQIITSYCRFQLGYKTINSSIQSPSNLTPSEVDNQKVVRSLYRHFWGKHKLFGYFSVDCLYVESGKKNKQQEDIKNADNAKNGKLYIIGMDCFLNEKVSSKYVPSLISKCQYMKEHNKYFIPTINSQENQKSFAKLNNQNLTQRSHTSRSITQQSYQQQSRVTSLNRKDPSNNELYYIYCPFIKQNNLPDTGTFFKQCKFNNISFDMQTKTGTLFLLQGGLQNGCLGFMCMGFSQYKVEEQALKLVQFLSKEFRDKDYKTHKNTKNKNGSDDLGQLRGYLLNSIRKYKQIHGNFKKEVINLQFIF